ncbi:protein shisa-6 isoform X2 [Lacerta agilis]|uniref:protein shisa-6 isoform X2 n=1 Tax=Lacerta agilis TaxID=80427 RepID=UPI00141A3868|nr:protein shisa-6 isoform X2 [Lacerta agilis]
MGWRHLLLLLPLALYALALLLTTQAAGPLRTTKGNRTQGAAAPRRPYKPAKEQQNQTLASTPPSPVAAGSGGNRGRSPARVPSNVSAGSSVPAYETCMGYYDVSGQWDKEFECNNSQKDFRYCCGTCYYRFCCNKRSEKLNQDRCRNQGPRPNTDLMTPATSNDGPGGIPNGYDPNEDNTNATVYISCGAVAFVVIAGIFAKVAYDKARQPPQEMNIHRALADILRQQGPIPIAHCERETISAIDTSPKDNTPIRTSSKNHYKPVRTSKSNPGHYGKDIYRSGGPDFHNFISSGFVTLGRGHSKDDQEQNYNHLILGTTNQTPSNEKPRMNSILTSATEPYDLSFSRSFQNLSHLPPSYESAIKTNPTPARDTSQEASAHPFNSSSLMATTRSPWTNCAFQTDKEAEEYYSRKRHLPDLAARGTLPLNVIQLSQKQTTQRERPRRVMRAMSQDRVLSPERIMPEEFSMSYERILSDEQLLSTERLHSQDPLLSPEHSGFGEQSMSRALSHSDVFVSTPVMDRYRMTKMHSHPSASNNLYNTLSMNQTSAKRQAFASRRHNTVEQLHYIPGHHHHYRTASKTEVTV